MKKKVVILLGVATAILLGVIWLVILQARKEQVPVGHFYGDVTTGNPGDMGVQAPDSTVTDEFPIGEGEAQTTEVSPVAGGVELLLSGALEMPQEFDGETIQEPEEEYGNLAIANVSDYVNVRSLPGTHGEIIGKIYDGAVAQILDVAGEDGDWFQIVSGNVEGYIKSEFFLHGEDAARVLDQYVVPYATVLADRLNVREAADIAAARIGYVGNGEKLRVLEDCGEWLKVLYTAEKPGYVSAEYVTVSEEYTYALTLAEEQEMLAQKRERENRLHTSEGSKPEILNNIVFPGTVYTSHEELRKGIVDYALQYVGYPYVHGGKSLAGGTDCSGFTCYIYAEFGYSISRTPGGQYSGAGRSISYTEIQPGDIICYSSNGGKSCTHVGLYIGDGQIVHAANSRKGVIVGNADYSPIIGIRNVID